jgi:hypothetical protein
MITPLNVVSSINDTDREILTPSVIDRFAAGSASYTTCGPGFFRSYSDSLEREAEIQLEILSQLLDCRRLRSCFGENRRWL